MALPPPCLNGTAHRGRPAAEARRGGGARGSERRKCGGVGCAGDLEGGGGGEGKVTVQTSFARGWGGAVQPRGRGRGSVRAEGPVPRRCPVLSGAWKVAVRRVAGLSSPATPGRATLRPSLSVLPPPPPSRFSVYPETRP